MPTRGRTPDRQGLPGDHRGVRVSGDDARLPKREVPHYHPHDLRHRRITIWHQSGVPARELAERAGHSRPSMSLDVYSHVMPADEVRRSA